LINLADFRAFPFRQLLGSGLSYNFSRISRYTDERFPQNESVRIENGEPILSPLCAKHEPEDLKLVVHLPSTIWDFPIDSGKNHQSMDGKVVEIRRSGLADVGDAKFRD
jgi:hypothetical protein